MITGPTLMAIAGTAVIAAVSQAEWDRFADNIRDGFKHINERVEELARGQSRMELWQREHTGSHELIAFRLNQLTDEQTRFIQEARAQHAIIAPPFKPDRKSDDDDKVSKSKMALAMVFVISFLSYVGQGLYALWVWAKAKP